MASYPATIKTFTTKENIVDVVDASHPNDSEAEITAMQTELGTNPRISTARAVTYASVKTRLEAIETDFRLKSDNPSHAALPGLTGDDHAQYLRTDGTRAPTGLGSMVAVPVAVQVGDTQSAGAANTLARSDHRHAATGAAPVASAVGDAQAAGAAQTLARSDHRHAREAYGAVVAGTSFGQAAADGVATTVARGDHTHGTPSLATAAPVTQAMGDAAAVGAAIQAAKGDHVHGMPAFGGSVSSMQAYGQAPSVGSSPDVARADHNHGTPAPDVRGPVGAIIMWPSSAIPTGWYRCDGGTMSSTTYSELDAVIGAAAAAPNTHRWNGGASPGAGLFKRPDLRSRAAVCVGQGASLTNRTLATNFGAETHVLTTAQMPVHNHGTVTSGGNNVSHNHGFGTGTASAVNHSHRIDHAHTAEVANNPGGTDEQGYPVGNNHLTLRSSDRAGAWASGLVSDVAHSSWDGGVNHTHSGTTNNQSANHTHSVGSNNAGSGSAHAIVQPSVGLEFIIYAGV